MADNQKTLFYKEGFLISIENSRNLMKMARISANEKQFGLACSLNILAAEEAIKAQFINYKSALPMFEIADFQQVFKDHKTKHKYIKIFLNSITKVIEKFKVRIPHIQALLNKSDSILSQKHIELKKKAAPLLNYIEILDDGAPLSEILIWLEKANNDKNLGFYVNITGKKWHNPYSITSEKFEKEAKFTRTLMASIEMMNWLQEDVLSKNNEETIKYFLSQNQI